MTDPTAAEVRAFVEAGHSQLEAAAHFGLSRAKVQRLLRSGASGDRVREVEDLADTLGPLDAAGGARLGVLLTLARKLDWIDRAQTAGAAMALPQVSKEYLGLLAAVVPPNDGDMQWLGAIFADFDRDVMTVALRRIASGTLSAPECAAVAREALPRTEPAFAPVGHSQDWQSPDA